ncbi:MAG: helix-turn-helix transcriptional regulator [Candidatus Lokiarchaeota archaeon]|nr:helix-turn-helix transcriptional regulator [Candidatus Lokiarchaeota archaeon]
MDLEDNEMLIKIKKYISDSRIILRSLINNHQNKIKHNYDRRRLEVAYFDKAISILTKKWTIHILWELEVYRGLIFNQLMRHLKNISSRSLSGTLKMLEELQLISRTVQETRPPSVLYKLTDKGKGVVELSIPLLFMLSDDE